MYATKTIAAHYLITESCISIYRSDAAGLEFIHSNHPLFDTLKAFLPRSTEFNVDINLTDSHKLLEVAAKTQHPELLAACDDLALDSVRLATVALVAKRIEKMHSAQIPTQPLVAFWQKLSTSILSIDNIAALLDVVGTPGLPLTWDGNLIAYRRGGFTDVPRLDLPNWMPGADSGNRSIKAQYLSPLNLVMRTCADLGVLNEALVFPQHIVDFSAGTGISVCTCRYLGEVPENYLQRCGDSGLVEIDSQIDEFGNSFYVRRPIDLDSAIAAASLASTYAGNTRANYKQELAVNLSC